jgi:hypothetical protein
MDTKYFEVHKDKYCAYCGEPIVEKEVFDGQYDSHMEYKCNCDIAKKEIEYQNQINEMERKKDWLVRDGIGWRGQEKIKLEIEKKQLKTQLQNTDKKLKELNN